MTAFRKTREFVTLCQVGELHVKKNVVLLSFP